MRIAFLIPPGGHSLGFVGPSDVFAEANRQLGRQAYDIQFISDRPEHVPCVSGLRFQPDATIHDPDEPIDTLIVAGPRDPPDAASEELVEWLRRRALTARRYGSVCAGAFLLGAAGLLDGKRATTHWALAPALAATCPSAIIEPDDIFVRDGALFTSAGMSAGIDLALALVEEDFGRSPALAVARWLVMFLKRPGGQSQFSLQLAAQIATRSQIQNVQQWVRDNPQAPLPVRELARRAGMSERTFARVFRQETGLTPADYVEGTRVDAGRRLLEETNLPLQRVASLSGFATTEAMRRAFRRKIRTTPIDYRLRFR